MPPIDINKIPTLTPINLDHVPTLKPVDSNLPINTSNELSGETELIRPDITGVVPYDFSSQEYQDLLGKNQSLTETTINNLETFGTKTISSVIGGAGYLLGTTNALYKAVDLTQDAKISDITENPLVQLSETMDDFAEKTFPNYESQDESENPYALRNFFDTITNQGIRDAAPFLAGMFIEGAAIGKIVSAPAKLAQMRKIASLNGELADKASLTSKLLQKAPPEITQLIVNNGEAMMEAHHTSEEVYKQSYDKSISQGLDEDQAKQIAETAQNEAFKNIYVMNMGILKINNLSTRSFFKSDLGSRRSYKQAIENYKDLSKVGKLQHIAKVGWDYAADPIKESSEELLQGGASQAVKNRLANTTNIDGSLNPEELYNSAIDTLSETIKRAQTGEGLAEMVISSILSGPISIRQKFQESKDERNNTTIKKQIYDSSIKSDYKDIEGLTESKEDPITKAVTQTLSSKGKELIDTARTYNDYENLKNAAIVMNDQSLYQIARDTQIANMAYGHFESGLGESLETKINDLSNEISKELKAQGKNTIEDFATGKNISIEEYTVGLKGKIKSYEEVYNILEGQYNISDPTTRQVLFNNAINQKELKRRLDNTKPIIGETWLNHRTSIRKDILNPKAIEDISKELESIQGKTDLQSIGKTIELNKLLQDHKNLQDFNNTATDLEIEENYKNYKSNKTNKLYYNTLKDQFKTLTNPVIANEYINSKLKENEEKTNDIINQSKVNTENISKNTSINNSTDILPTEETDDKPVNLPSEILEQNDILSKEIDNQESSEDPFDKFNPEKQAKEALNNFEASSNIEPAFENTNLDDSEVDPKEIKFIESVKEINKKIDKQEKEDKIKANSIPLYITNRFEKSINGFININKITKETELENQQALEELLKLKPGDKVDSQIGFYENNKFLTYNESKEKSPKTLAIRLFKNGIKLGAIKHSQEQDIKEVFYNIELNPGLHNHILTSELEVNSKWGGFIRNLVDNQDNKIKDNYKEIPFDERAFINSPSDVVGSNDFIVITSTNDGKLLTSKYSKKALGILGLKDSNDIYKAFNKENLKPGVMYTLIKSPDGSIVPITSHGEYITKENKDYIISEVKLAITNKNKDLKDLKNNIQDYIYYDRTNGLYISSGKVYYKSNEIGLKGLLDLFEKQNIYKPVDLKTKSTKELNKLLKLNIPKASSIQFINPKVTLDLTPLKSLGTIIQESKDLESNDSLSDINTVDLPKIEITNEIKEDSIKDLQDFENIPDSVISEYTQNLYSNINLNPENQVLNPESKQVIINQLLKKYNKTKEQLSNKDISNINTKELLEQLISCL